MPNLLCQDPVVDPSLVEPAPLAPDGEAEDREDHGQFDPAPKVGCSPPAPVRHEPHHRRDGRHPLWAQYHREGGSIPVGVVGRQVVEPPMGRGPTLRSIGPECRGRGRPTGPARARRWPRDSSRGSGAPPAPSQANAVGARDERCHLADPPKARWRCRPDLEVPCGWRRRARRLFLVRWLVGGSGSMLDSFEVEEATSGSEFRTTIRPRSIRFFESPSSIPPRDNRVCDDSFMAMQARSINTEGWLDFDAPKREL